MSADNLEIWKPILGEGMYSVSNLGRVKNHHNRLLRTNIREGYPRIKLVFKGKRRNFFIHRLSAIAFIPNTENKQCINHIDGNKLNNRVENLEWCTNIENVQHAYRTGLMKPWGMMKSHHDKKPSNAKLSEGIILEMISMREQGFRFREIATRFNASITNTRRVIHKQSWKHLYQ